MKLSALCIGVSLLSVTLGNAQESHSDQAPGIVLYDPLFWKDQLKLDAFQCQKIREINSEYYEKLSTVVHETPNVKEVQVKAAESLQQRSEEIWETFHPKQRKRWRKIWENTSDTI